MAVFSLSPHMAFSHSVHAVERRSSFFLSPYKTTSPIRLGCHPYHPIWGFPGSSAGKEYTCNAGDPSLIPGLGRSAEEGVGYSLQYSWLNSKESICNAKDLVWIHGLGRSPGGGHGNPFHYSCLENPMDKEPGRLQSIGSHRVGHD